MKWFVNYRIYMNRNCWCSVDTHYATCVSTLYNYSIWCSPSLTLFWRPFYISKKHFRPGGMAPSEWMRSVRAVRDTPVADDSAPGVNTTRRVAYRPPITVSPFLLALSVFCFKQTLWRCGQLWPYVGMGSLGTHLHRDCNGWRCENLSSRSFYIKLEERRKVRRYHTTRPWGSTQLRGSTKSRTERVRPKVGKDRVWIFIVW